MNPRCRAGDLAVVVDAYYRSNLGRIVKVLAPHDGQGDLVFRGVGAVWLVKSPQTMTWTIGSRRIRRKRGPVPDAYLKPIRGTSIPGTIAFPQYFYEVHKISEKVVALA
jgi:hypothetical protein